MKNKISFFLLIVIFLAPELLTGQKKLVHTLTSQHYGIREGLTQMQTFRVFQDSYGYIWTVMNGGVSRFDGKNFRTYTHADLGLKRRVLYINQYKESVFFVTRDGISFLHSDGSTTFYSMLDGYKIGIGGLYGESCFVMADGRLYMVNCLEDSDKPTNKCSFFIFDLENKIFKKLSERPFVEMQLHLFDNKLIILEQGENSCLRVYEISGDTLLLLKEFALNKEKRYYFTENIPGNELFLSETTADEKISRVYSCIFSEDNTFTKEFICEMPYLIRVTRRIDENRFIVTNMYDAYLIEGKQQRTFPINTILVNYAMKDRDGNLWLATEEGLINCYHLLFDSYKLGVKHNDYIWTVRKDVFDNIWFASYGLGFWRADKDENITKAKVYDKGRERALDLAYMDSAEDSLGRIFFTSDRGLAVFDPRKGNSADLTLYKTGVSLAVYYDTITNSIYSGGTTALGDSWATTLVRMNEQLETQMYPLSDKHIICINRDSKHRLRIGTYAGEYIFDEESEIFIEDTVVRPYSGVIAMELDREGFLWKGTTAGVYVEDPEGNLMKIRETSQSTPFIMCYDNRYIIWGASDKLAIMDLPAFHKDTTQVHIRTFDSYSGYDVLECGQNGNYIDKDGYVWVVGADMVLRFHPDELMAKPETIINPPYIAAVFNKDKDNDWNLVRRKDILVFDKKSNNFRFDLLQASVMAPNKLTFRYHLKGYSDYWISTNERSVVFQNIPHGKYYFEVQSSIDGEEWSESAMSQLITIKPPFWLTLSGLLLLSAGVILLLLSIVYWVRRLSIKKQEIGRASCRERV